MSQLVDFEVSGRRIADAGGLSLQYGSSSDLRQLGRRPSSRLDLQDLESEGSKGKSSLAGFAASMPELKSLVAPSPSSSSSKDDSSPRWRSAKMTRQQTPDCARERSSLAQAQQAREMIATAASPSRSCRESRCPIIYDEATRGFHLLMGSAQYSFRLDRNGWLEHLYWGARGPFVEDLTFATENDPAGCHFEPAPPGSQYSLAELRKMIYDGKLDARQLWITAKMLNKREEEWELQRLENITWRIRHFWNKDGMLNQGMLHAEASHMDCAVLSVLERSAIPFLKFGSHQDASVASKGALAQLDPETKGLIESSANRASKLLEFAEFGTGDYRSPSLSVLYLKDGSRLSPLLYQDHQIRKGIVPTVSGLPVLGTDDGPCDANQAWSLVVKLVDPYTWLQVRLIYTVFEGLPVLSRRCVVNNETAMGTGHVELSRCFSSTVDFHTSDWHMLTLNGGWAHERNMVVSPLREGLISVESTRGVSSHQANPFCVLSEGAPREDSGWCFGFGLVYSGNWKIEAEMSDTGRTRVNIGINPTNFTWDLALGACFETPEAVLVFSEDGLSGMSAAYHQVYKQKLISPRWRDHICPVLLNTWEALYFEVYHDRVMALATQAKSMGVELLVVDDGWFLGRDSDYSSLGDWKADPRKLPNGLGGLVADVKSLDMQFGIWVEPEMVNTNSELYRSHPEWVLHQPQRVRGEGRHQLVLDLTRRDVQDYIIEAISAVLRCGVDYVKWDMNRAISEPFSAGLGPRQQGEVYHRYVLGLYRIFDSLTTNFPQVLFESCSSGGGRYDPGLLKYCPQAWCSDNTDALSRVRIQLGTSLWSPVPCMGSHISQCPNHQTFRTISMKTRFVVALWGTFGLEFDVTKLSALEITEVASYIQLRQRLCPIVLSGVLHRLQGFGYPYQAMSAISANAGGSSTAAWMSVSENKSKAVLAAVVSFREPVGQYVSRLRLRGLDPSQRYAITELCPTVLEEGVYNGNYTKGGPTPQFSRQLVVTGHALMNVGLPIHFRFDGDSVLFELNAV